jgi:hypothetical protein
MFTSTTALPLPVINLSQLLLLLPLAVLLLPMYLSEPTIATFTSPDALLLPVSSLSQLLLLLTQQLLLLLHLQLPLLCLKQLLLHLSFQLLKLFCCCLYISLSQ